MHVQNINLLLHVYLIYQWDYVYQKVASQNTAYLKPFLLGYMYCCMYNIGYQKFM